MKPEKVTIAAPQEQLWTLSGHRRHVAVLSAPLPIAGLPEFAKFNMHFDAGTVDQIIERLSLLRARMLPEPKRNWRRTLAQETSAGFGCYIPRTCRGEPKSRGV